MATLPLLLLGFILGFLVHWIMGGRQRRLLREYRKYKKAMASVDAALMVERKKRRR
jgi:hypothetical protein